MLTKLSIIGFLLITPICVISSQSLSPAGFFSAIIVNQMDTSLKWYSTFMGCEIQNQIHLQERGLRQANLECGSLKLELIETGNSISAEGALSEIQANRIQGFFKIGLVVDNFDSWMDRAEEFKVAIRGNVVVLEETQTRTVILLDPDGNRIQLFEN